MPVFEALLIVAGFIVLIKSGDFLVDQSVLIARYFGISELVIGLTVVAFGTSAPELMINIDSALQGIDEFVFGNVLGSNMINILVVLGLTGIITPLSLKSSTVKIEMPFLIVITIVLSIIVNDTFFDAAGNNILSRIDALILLSFFVVFLVYNFRLAKYEKIEDDHPDKPNNVWKHVFLFILACFGLRIGSSLVVNNAIIVGEYFHVPNDIMGLTVLAIGTSLPELVVSLQSAKKGIADLAVGGMIGSNIFNTLIVLGIGALVAPPSFNPILNYDLLVVNMGTILLFVFMFFGRKNLLSRRSSVTLLSLYVVYAVFRSIIGF
jgi:cation:H+ antiporter